MHIKGKRLSKDSQNATMQIGVSIACALVILAIFFYFLPSLTLETKPNARSDLFTYCVAPDLSNQDKDNITISDFLDYSPMFVPTRWNYSPLQKPAANPKGWDISVVETRNLGSELKTTDFITGGKTALAPIYNITVGRYFYNFARAPLVTTNKAEEVRFSLVNLDTSKHEFSASLKDIDTSKIISTAEFYVNVDKDGWVQRPLLRETSGSDTIDAQLSKMLSKKGLLNGVKSGAYKAVFAPQ